MRNTALRSRPTDSHLKSLRVAIAPRGSVSARSTTVHFATTRASLLEMDLFQAFQQRALQAVDAAKELASTVGTDALGTAQVRR